MSWYLANNVFNQTSTRKISVSSGYTQLYICKQNMYVTKEAELLVMDTHGKILLANELYVLSHNKNKLSNW